MYHCFFFFFQAEDGIRDKLVTGVQTCALPISGDHDIEAREVRHLDQRGDAAPFLSNDTRAGAAIFDFARSVGTVAALVFQTLDEKGIAGAVGKRARDEKAGKPGLGARTGEKSVAHPTRAEPLGPGEILLAS